MSTRRTAQLFNDCAQQKPYRRWPTDVDMPRTSVAHFVTLMVGLFLAFSLWSFRSVTAASN